MKKRIGVLLLLLCLAGCQARTAELDIPALSRQFQEKGPGMLVLSGQQMEQLCGIAPADVARGQVLLCSDSLRADEIWILEAADGQALQRLRQAAQRRLAQKAEESRSYDPVQYEVVRQAKLVTRGRYLVLLVSPEAEAMARLLPW